MRSRRVPHPFLGCIGVLLAAAVFLQANSFLVPFLEFQALHKFIVNELCVKRAAPVNDCQGQCHLRNRVAEQEEEKRDRSPAAPLLPDQVSYLPPERISGLPLPTVVEAPIERHRPHGYARFQEPPPLPPPKPSRLPS
jgi:hypothetical protein